MAAAEHGDRAAFLGRARTALARGAPPNLAHPRPAVVTAQSPVPVARRRSVGADLVSTFVDAATAADAVVDVVTGTDVPVALLEGIVDAHGVRRAVVSADAAARVLGASLEQLGVAVSPVAVDAAAQADLGVTGAVAAIASTGSVVLDCARAGSRVGGLLPRVHLCVVDAAAIVLTPSEVLRPLGAAPDRLPSNLVLVSGPSRTGDIEQILTLGVHGPTALRIVVLGPHPPPSGASAI
jgi:L-lactate dehydrogenase complex protein LldG